MLKNKLLLEHKSWLRKIQRKAWKQALDDLIHIIINILFNSLFAILKSKDLHKLCHLWVLYQYLQVCASHYSLTLLVICLKSRYIKYCLRGYSKNLQAYFTIYKIPHAKWHALLLETLSFLSKPLFVAWEIFLGLRFLLGLSNEEIGIFFQMLGYLGQIFWQHQRL